MLKAPPLIPWTYIFSVIYCNCRTYDDNIGQILHNLRFATFGAYNMFDNKFDQHRPEVCPEIGKIRHVMIKNQGLSRIRKHFKDITFIKHIASMSTYFIGPYSIVDLFTYFRAFLNIFQNILTPLCRVYIVSQRNLGPRNKTGCFQHPPLIPYLK